MGTFEKLGILVIVVIIVMILAVAISQWGGIGSENDGIALAEGPKGTLTIRDLDELEKDWKDDRSEGTEAEPVADDATWPGGVPKVHEIGPDDRIWNLVVRDWKLKETFIAALTAANPKVDVKRLRPGQKLLVPDPGPYLRSAGGSGSDASAGVPARRYEVKPGDTLELIAKIHLGDALRWKEILELNPGLKPRRLRTGQVILVPAR